MQSNDAYSRIEYVIFAYRSTNSNKKIYMQCYSVQIIKHTFLYDK